MVRFEQYTGIYEGGRTADEDSRILFRAGMGPGPRGRRLVIVECARSFYVGRLCCRNYLPSPCPLSPDGCCLAHFFIIIIVIRAWRAALDWRNWGSAHAAVAHFHQLAWPFRRPCHTA